ncbi:hypothetical protein AB1L42_22285 [Thalassoglobus sp. JC818]|uniref:hypothetical protein n=1 Tax=Thalassoglobus sp. JC818 TaxID=3232136 RepID=UPI003458EF8D
MKLADDIVRVSFRREDFRISFSQPFLLVFVVALLTTECVFVLNGEANFQLLAFVLPLLVTVLCTSAILLLKYRFPFQVSRDGIACYDFWCRPQRTSWDAVSDCEIVTTAGLRYLKVRAKGNSRDIWIPLFVTRSATLRDLLSLYLSCESRDCSRNIAELLEGAE